MIMIARLAMEGGVITTTTTTTTTAYYTQAATFVANGIEHSVIQQSTAKRWVLRAILNENFDCEFLMSYGSLFQKTGPADEKDF